MAATRVLAAVANSSGGVDRDRHRAESVDFLVRNTAASGRFRASPWRVFLLGGVVFLRQPWLMLPVLFQLPDCTHFPRLGSHLGTVPGCFVRERVQVSLDCVIRRQRNHLLAVGAWHGRARSDRRAGMPCCRDYPAPAMAVARVTGISYDARRSRGISQLCDRRLWRAAAERIRPDGDERFLSSLRTWMV